MKHNDEKTKMKHFDFDFNEADDNQFDPDDDYYPYDDGEGGLDDYDGTED